MSDTMRNWRNVLCASLFVVVAALYVTARFDSVWAQDTSSSSVADGALPTESEVDALSRINRLVASKALPAVVHVVTLSEAQTDHPDISELPEEWRRFFKDNIRPPGPTRGQGSGVIIDAQSGFVLTNSHVVDDATEIEVRLSDGRRFDARLVGNDPPTDLAVIQIDADNLSDLELGDSNKLEVGDPVMTVGNPFGLEGTFSKGIVSAKDRSSLGIIDYEGFIQTDAVINPGNSGGPLVNMRGEIVGINTAIETRTGAYNGIGFAIPSARIMQVLPALLRGETVVRGYLGVMIGNVLQIPDKAEELHWDHLYGVIVSDVVPDSPAAEIGLKADDIIARIDGVAIKGTGQLLDTVAYTQPGESLVLDVWRDGHLVSFRIVVGRQPTNFSTRVSRLPSMETEPSQDQGDSQSQRIEISDLGIAVQDVDDRLKKRYELDPVVQFGAIITGIDEEGVAGKHGVHIGEVITAVNGNTIHDVSELNQQIGRVDPDTGIDLRLLSRQGARHVLLFPSR